FASAFFCPSLPAQSASPSMPPATSSSASRPTSVFVVCFMARSPALAGLPDHQPGEEQPEGEQVEGEEGHRALLLGREEQVVALALLWPDGDARLFLGYPGHRVQGEVLVSGEAEVAVGGEQGVADDDHPRFGASRSITSSLPTWMPQPSNAPSSPLCVRVSTITTSLPPFSTQSLTSLASPSVNAATGPATTRA